MDEELSLLHMNPSMFKPLFDCGPLVSFQGHAQWYCASRVGGWTWSCLWGCKGWIGGKLVTTNYWYLQCRGTPVCVWIIQNQPNRKEKQDVTLPWWQNFWIPTILLDRDGHLHCWTMEEKYGPLFCSLVQSCTGKSYTFFFCYICSNPIGWDPEILPPWQRDVTTSLYCRIKDRV